MLPERRLSLVDTRYTFYLLKIKRAFDILDTSHNNTDL